MIHKVNDNEFFNLVLKITTYEGRDQIASISVHVILTNKRNGKVLKDWFAADEYNAALQRYNRYNEMFFSERSESA